MRFFYDIIRQRIGEKMIRRHYRLANILILILAMLITSTLFIFTIQEISKIYAENTRQSIYDVKKSYLYDNVNNFIINIDTKLDIATKNQEVEFEQMTLFFEALDATNETQYEEIFMTFHEDSMIKETYDVILWKNSSIIYQSNALISSVNEDIYAAMAYGENEVYTFFIGATKDWMESAIKIQLRQQIHESIYQYEAYMWVNEIINYDGGDNYAIRRIHPNAEEGVFLSTSMTDIQGNFPYLEELEGVKEEGEIFFTYFFKKLSTNDIAEKLTYAKLYDRFDWIIAMGIYIDETDAYITEVNQLSQDLAVYFVLLFITILIVITLSTYIATLYLKNREHAEEKRILQNRINFDKLTGVLSRNVADDIFSLRFQQYKKDGQSPIFVMFDIDGFKQINDSYGHSCGDQFLRAVAQKAKSYVREQDLVFRYGGDEFIVLYDGLKIENAIAIANGLIESIESIDEFCHLDRVKVTISIGISYFQKDDTTYEDVLQRADKALYDAKKNGKNQAKLYTE